MSIKDLFGKTSRNLEDTVQDVESVAFVEEKTKADQAYHPQIDFSDPKNFVYYGSAELYYDAAIRRIYEDYPYDGSKSEQIAFEQSASELERWVFENKYPKTTGHVKLGTTADLAGLSGVYRATTTPEYIRVWGGLHTDSNATNLSDHFASSARYDSDKNRNQNWNCDFTSGATVEFWMKKDSTTANEAEVILDLWNGSSTSTNSRMIVEFAEFASRQYIRLRLLKNATTQTKIFELTSFATGTWFHFAVSLAEEDGVLEAKSYVNGTETFSTNFASTYTFEGKMDGFIGAMQTSFDGFGATASGKFQGYLDEFRFWKTKRTGRQIKLNWLDAIGGGANTDDATSDLGVYFKFNEGITGTSTTDATVLDYSGRLANGTWIGYSSTTSARSIDSAINLSGYTETPSPIIYSTHPTVTSLISEMQTSGSVYDADRGQAFFRSMPTWLQEEDNGNLRLFSQILGSYMDTLHVQIKELTELKTKRYPTSGIKASTFAADLLKDKGFMISTMFENDEVYEKLAAINLQDNQFETELHEIKNIIYTNIYNNLEKIYKTKGTEGSIRNLIRCYGIDDELIRLNLYTDGGTQYFTDKSRETSVKKKYINFNDPDHFDSVIYQVASSANPNSYIAASADASRNAFTMEADIVVPHKKEVGEAGYFDTSFISASVMGFHEAAAAPADFTWGTQNLCVYLVRDSVGSRNAKFVLRNELGTIKQESDFIYDIYENEHYNVAVRIKPQTYPYAGGVTNTAPNYDVELYAVTTNFGEVEQEVLLSQTISNADGLALMNASKRVYAGAHIVDFTGTTAREKSDIQVGGVRVWFDYLENDEILQHNKDVLNYGMRSSIDGSNLYLIDDIQIPTQDLTILNWDFDTVATSDGSGEFDVEDITSGHTDTIYGTIDDIIRREHKAKGANFPLNDVSVFGYEFIQAYKKQLPESAYDAQNIYIKGEQEINFSDDDDVSDNLFVMEKSPSALISEEMLKSFSTTVEFANLIGRPVDRYRVEYKDLAKARQLFFDKVERDIDFDRFFEYFKWIDSNISSMVNQLIPLSANFAGGIVDVIEPHILERDKYQRQVGLLSTVTSTEASMRGVQEMKYNWRTGHAPLSGDQNENCLWQKERREGTIIDVLTNQNEQSSSNPINLSGSNGVYQGNTYATRRFSRPYSISANFNYSIHGGINYSINKNRDALTDMIPPGNSSDGTGAPEGIVTVAQANTNPKPTCIDENRPPEISKYKYDGFATVGKESALVTQIPRSDENHYAYRQKISKIFPGNIMSSSVNTGYSAMLNQPGPDGGLGVGLNVVNLHSDTTDITNVIPIQGPFTQEHIGGRQVRHIHITEAVSPERGYVTSSFDRPEFWGVYRGLLDFDLDGTAEIEGALGLTTPDYQLGSLDAASQKATFFREERAKRPVNIKNIRTDLDGGPHGNFTHNYEVLSTFGDQDYYFRRMSGSNLLPSSIGQALPETTNYFTLASQSPSEVGNIFGELNNRQYDTRVYTGGQAAAQATGGNFRVLGIDRITSGHYIAIDSKMYEIDTSVQSGEVFSLESTDIAFYDGIKAVLESNFSPSTFTVSYSETITGTPEILAVAAGGGGFTVLGTDDVASGDYITIGSTPYEIATSVQGGKTITIESTNSDFYDGIKTLLEVDYPPSTFTVGYTETTTLDTPATAGATATGGAFRILGPDDVTSGHYIDLVQGSTTNTYEVFSSAQAGSSTIAFQSTTTDFYNGVKSLLEADFPVSDFTVAYTPGDNGGTASTPSQGISFLGGHLGSAGLEYSGIPSWSPASEGTANVDPFTISFFINAPVTVPAATDPASNAMIYQSTRHTYPDSGLSVYLEADSSSGWHLVFVDVYANNGLSGGLVRTPKLWKYNDFIKGGTEYGGQLTHVIITSDGDRNPAPTVRLYINGSQKSWDVTPSYGTTGAHTSIKLDGFYVGCNAAFANFLSLDEDPTKGTILDELMIFDSYFGSAASSNSSIDEIYNNGNHLDYSGLSSLSTYANVKAFYTFSETGDGFDNGDTIHNAVAGAAEDLTVTDGTYTYTGVSYEKIESSSTGAPSLGTIIYHADFTITPSKSPDSTGTYGNFTVNIPVVGHTSFSNTSDSTGGIDFVAAVYDSEADFTITPSSTGTYGNFSVAVGSGTSFSNPQGSTGGVNYAAAVNDSHADFTIVPTAVGSYGNFSVNIPVASHISFSNTQNSIDGLDYIAPTVTGDTNIVDTQDRTTGSVSTVRTRFSAPGGPEINSSGYLDVATQQYSVHNSLNYRNLSTRSSGSGEATTIRVNSHSNRREGLRTLRARHQGQFGLDSLHGTLSSTVYTDLEASFHKQHRNSAKIEKRSEFSKLGTTATAILNVVAEAACKDGEMFTVTDTAGVTTTYRISTGLNYLASGTNAAAYVAAGTDGRGTAGTITVGIAGRTTVEEVRDEIVMRINAGTNTDFSAEASSSSTITITQTVIGSLGNRENENLPSPSSGLFALGIENFTGGLNPTPRRYNNDHYHTPLPASDFQYSWINAAVSGSDWESNQVVLGYAPKNGIISSSSGIDSAINFPASDLECFPCFHRVETLVSVVNFFGKAATALPTPISANDNGSGWDSSTNTQTLVALLDNASIDRAPHGGVMCPTIDDSRLNDTFFSNTYIGCCDLADFTYALAVDGASPTYSPTEPTLPTIYFNQDCTVSMEYYVQQCTGLVDSITLNVVNASVLEPISTASFVETKTDATTATIVTTITASSDYTMQLSTDIHVGATTDTLNSIVFGSQLTNFCCTDVTFEYDYSNTPSGLSAVLPGGSFTSVSTNEIQLNGTSIAHVGPSSSTVIGTLSYSAGATVRFLVRMTDCNENTDTIQITINDAVL